MIEIKTEKEMGAIILRLVGLSPDRWRGRNITTHPHTNPKNIKGSEIVFGNVATAADLWNLLRLQLINFFRFI